MSNPDQAPSDLNEPPKNTQHRTILSFTKASKMSASDAAAERHELTVPRAWGLGQSGQHMQETTKQHQQQRSAVAPMMQRWLHENREQSWDNIASVIVVRKSEKSIQDNRKEEERKNPD